VSQQSWETDVEFYEQKEIESLLPRGTAGYVPNREKQGNSWVKLHCWSAVREVEKGNLASKISKYTGGNLQTNSKPDARWNSELVGSDEDLSKASPGNLTLPCIQKIQTIPFVPRDSIMWF
jgi:hypothetical protein